jgi:hypothetical protein
LAVGAALISTSCQTASPRHAEPSHEPGHSAAASAPRAAPQRDATDRAGRWDFTLAGTGSNDKDFDVGGSQVAANVGFFLADAFEASIRQTLGFADAGEGIPDVWNGTSRLALDFVFPLHPIEPFVGANIGYVYGDTVKETMAGAPEAGVRFFLKDDAYIHLLGEYQFFFDESDRIGDVFEDGQFLYEVGMGIRF